MRVKMLKDAPGSPDGIHVNEYAKGNVYEVTDSLGDAFIGAKLAKLDKPEPAPAPKPVAEESKQDAGPEENK